MRFRVHIAASLDGFIAGPGGDVAWLAPFPAEAYGHDAFLETIETVILGRASYEQVLRFGDWPFGAKRTIVLTTRPIDAAAEGVEAYAGDVGAIAAELREAGGGDTWVMGGASVVRAFLDAGLIDEIELFIVPRLLGAGIPLFTRSPHQSALALIEARSYTDGVVQLLYRLE